MRVKNFFSGRRKYLQEAESGGDLAAEEAYEAELAEKQKKLQEMRQEIMAYREAELLEKQAKAEGPQESMVAGDIYRARTDLVKNPLSRAALAVVRVQSLLRAVVALPFAMAAWAFRSWQAMFATQRYENFLMAEGERIWYWRNRTENERWFWEIFVWDRLIFPILAVACYEYLVPNHLLWAVVAPLALLTWLTGKLISPITPEFWLVAYLGFYRKCWPDVAAWLSNVLLAW